MVATREQLRSLNDRPVRLARVPLVSVPAPGASTVTRVRDYQVSTLRTTGETIAFPFDNTGAQLRFQGPHDLHPMQLHKLAVRYLRRRDPDYHPQGRVVTITLDASGRARNVDRL